MRNELVEMFTEEKMTAVDAIIERHRDNPGELLMVLVEVQDITRYLPVELQRYIAWRMGIPASRVYGVASFYSYFSLAPRGRKVVKVCTGTACYVKRAGEIKERLKQRLGLSEGEVSADGEFSIEEVRCLGACGLAPVAVIGEETFGLINPDNVEEILEKASS